MADPIIDPYSSTINGIQVGSRVSWETSEKGQNVTKTGILASFTPSGYVFIDEFIYPKSATGKVRHNIHRLRIEDVHEIKPNPVNRTGSH